MLVMLPGGLGVGPSSVPACSDPGALCGPRPILPGTRDMKRGGSWAQWWRGLAAAHGTSSP